MRIKFRHPRSQDPYVPSSARELPRFLVGPEPDSDARRATAARRGPERFQTRRETVGARDGHVEDAARARAATTNRLDRARTPATGRLYVSRMVNPSRPSPNPTLTFFYPPSFVPGKLLPVSLFSSRLVDSIWWRCDPSATFEQCKAAADRLLATMPPHEPYSTDCFKRAHDKLLWDPRYGKRVYGQIAFKPASCVGGVLRRRRRGGVRRAPAQAVGEDVQRAERDSARHHRHAARARGRGGA